MASSWFRKHTLLLKWKKKWKNEMGGQIVFSHRTSNCRGVATLFPQNVDFNIQEKYSDDSGRFLLLKCKFEEMSYIILNCYAPTQQYKKYQINFINFIKLYINKFENENFIIGGDFNFCMDPELNKQKNMTSKDNNPAFRQEMNALLESLNLANCWRNMLLT